MWIQEYSSLFEEGYSNPNPRQQILDDLEEEINRIRQDPQHHLILMIDANESLYKKVKIILYSLSKQQD